MTDKIFADGFIAKRHQNAPDFVITGLSIKVDDAVSFLKQHESEGWVNLQVKQSKAGKLYCELDTWRPTQGEFAKQGIAEATQAAEEPANSNPKSPQDQTNKEWLADYEQATTVGGAVANDTAAFYDEIPF